MNTGLLTIEPEHELRFVGPFNRAVVTVMTLTNNSPQTLVFKIKTTAPKRYCVRPNIGKIPPFKASQVEICLQPFMYDQNEKNKHKFMVQSVQAPPDADLVDLNKLWKELEPDQLVDAKLKCVFEMPSEANAESNSGAGGDGAGASVIGATSIETLKADAPKLASEEKPSAADIATVEGQLAEIKALRELNSELRKENLHMKDQVMRLRYAPQSKQANEPYTPVLAEKQIPVFYIAIAIAAAILGLLLGKFLL